MTADFAYDPVTAIDEAQATGETAVLLAEIRQTMRIPLVTSIWRGLAGMDDCLRLAWAAAKPIYESGEPERALMRSVAAVGLPRPEPLAPTAIVCVGTHRKRYRRGARCHRCLQGLNCSPATVATQDRGGWANLHRSLSGFSA